MEKAILLRSFAIPPRRRMLNSLLSDCVAGLRWENSFWDQMPSEFCSRRIARFWRLRQNGNLPITDVVVLPDNVKQWQPDYNGKSLVTSRHYVLPKGRLCHRLILVRCPMSSIIPHYKIYSVVEPPLAQLTARS